MAENPHTKLVGEILVAASALPATMVWKNNTGKLPLPGGGMIVFGLKGSADILGASRGHPIAIEAKTGTGRQRDQQVKFQRAWEAAGGLYILARSVEDVLAALDR